MSSNKAIKEKTGADKIMYDSDQSVGIDSSEAAENSNESGVLVIGLTGGIGTGKSTAAEYLTAKGMKHIDADAISRNLTEKVPGQPNPVLEEIGRAFTQKQDGPEAEGEDAAGADAAVNENASDTEGSADACLAEESADVIRPDGSLDRKAMARIVFSDPEKKKVLEDILFREIIARIHKEIDQARNPQETDAACNDTGSPQLSEENTVKLPIVLLDVPLLFESGLDSLCDKVIVLTADEDVRIERVTRRDGCNSDDVRDRMRNQMSDEEKRARADYIVDNSGGREDLFRQLDQVLAKVHLF